MKYALLIYADRDVDEEVERMPEEERRAIVDEFLALRAAEPGLLAAAQLHPAASETTVRMEEGDVLVTDGPFADTKELLGGVWLLEADDLDAALALARRIPSLRVGGAVEVRPIVER
jgi:hypothetical protein